MGEGKSEGFRHPPPLDLGDLRAISVLGRGAKGIVFRVAADDGRSLALKAISRSNIESKNKRDGDARDNYKRIWFERDVLSDLQYPLLPSLHGFVSTNEIVGFAIDRCSGGDLSALRRRQTEKMFSEDIIRFYAAELVLVLEHLHGMGIVYRDLKPENILIQDSGHLMLVDFDLSTKLTPRPSPIRTPHKSPKLSDETTTQKKRQNPNHSRRLLRSWFACNPKFAPDFMETEAATPEISSRSTSTASSSSATSSMKSNSFVGTEEYVAPEVIEGTGHDFSVDWWSLGVVLYEMLYGRTPFRGQNRKETFSRILYKPPDLAGEKTALRDLIGRLLEKDPNKRISVEEIKEHDYFHGIDWNFVLKIYRPPFIPDDDQLGQDEAENHIDIEEFLRVVYANSTDGKSGSGGDTEEKRKRKESDDHSQNTVVTSTNGNFEKGTGWYGASSNPNPPAEFLVF